MPKEIICYQNCIVFKVLTFLLSNKKSNIIPTSEQNLEYFAKYSLSNLKGLLLKSQTFKFGLIISFVMLNNKQRHFVIRSA